MVWRKIPTCVNFAAPHANKTFFNLFCRLEMRSMPAELEQAASDFVPPTLQILLGLSV